VYYQNQPLDAFQCYQTLGLSESASLKEIKHAYRQLSLKYHPDRNKERESDKKFKEITEAYQFLKQEQKRSNASHKDAASAHADFWNYYDKKTSDDFRFNRQANFEEFTRNFGANFNEPQTHNMEKPVSHKMTHVLLYGGLVAMALWIILSEILK
jgi:DnaJ-class molecular chaperone